MLTTSTTPMPVVIASFVPMRRLSPTAGNIDLRAERLIAHRHLQAGRHSPTERILPARSWHALCGATGMCLDLLNKSAVHV
jgi:hypothetical protein